MDWYFYAAGAAYLGLNAGLTIAGVIKACASGEFQQLKREEPPLIFWSTLSVALLFMLALGSVTVAGSWTWSHTAWWRWRLIDRSRVQVRRIRAWWKDLVQ